jgi:predicted MFS family arabinose efflux permease
MAAACGIAVANLYYSQPLLAEMARQFQVSQRQMGLVSALTQVGYALGLLFFVPLGDVLERRRLILVMLGASVVALVAVALSPGFVWLAVASLALGAATVAPQMIVPLAAGLTPPERRGAVVGRVMSGLLIGILISRTVSGLVGARLGWRSIYWIAAAISVLLALLLRAVLPQSRPSVKMSYPRLLQSLGKLFVNEPLLRESCLFGAAGFGAFSAFWTTLAFFVAGPPYGYGSGVAGLFGLAGVAGAIVAPIAGRLADSRGPRLTIGAALAIMVMAYGGLAAFGHELWALIFGVILLDLGAQANQISNQARIYSLAAEAHNRLNTVYMVSFFAGGAIGSWLAAYAWSRWGWSGVCTVGTCLLLVGLARFVLPVCSAEQEDATLPPDEVS